MDAYTTIDQAWQATVAKLFRCAVRPSRVGDMRELVGYSFKLTDLRQNVLLNPRRCISAPYAAAELLWYLSGEDKIDRVVHYAPQYAQFADENGISYGAYGPRFKVPKLEYGMTAVTAAYKVLIKSPDSRQCVISIWRPSDLFEVAIYDRANVPCTLTWQFIARDGKLHMVVNMRSNDVWLGLPYDVFCFTSIQQLVAGELRLKVGEYTHVVGSMHLYEKHHAAAQEARTLEVIEPWMGYEGGQTTRDLNYALHVEHVTRLSDYVSDRYIYPAGLQDELMHDLIKCVAYHNGYLRDKTVRSLPLAFALEQWSKKHANH